MDRSTTRGGRSPSRPGVWLIRQTPLGAVAVIHDLTAEESLRQKQDLVDRAAFWTDLAASMSHEIRNPLVAIKTFAQLLPERFDDPDFRKDFNEIVVQEIDRLDKIITQINNFAHPPELVMKPLDLRAPVRKAMEIAGSRLGQTAVCDRNNYSPTTYRKCWVTRLRWPRRSRIWSRMRRRLRAGQKKGRDHFGVPNRSAKAATPAELLITVQDNGKGIAPDAERRKFSRRFAPPKPRGMGLGLPIVKRTVFDHNGRVDIDSNPHGTLVSVMLPASSNGLLRRFWIPV